MATQVTNNTYEGSLIIWGGGFINAPYLWRLGLLTHLSDVKNRKSNLLYVIMGHIFLFIQAMQEGGHLQKDHILTGLQ